MLRHSRAPTHLLWVTIDTTQQLIDCIPSICCILGILLADSSVRLLENGKKWLEMDSKQRDNLVNWHGGERSRLTLKSVYEDRPGEGSRIAVWIRGLKRKSAMYFTGESFPGDTFLPFLFT